MVNNIETTITKIKCLVDFLRISTESMIFYVEKDGIMPTEQELRNACDGLNIAFDLLKQKINTIEENVLHH